jgi:hypothetical protein
VDYVKVEKAGGDVREAKLPPRIFRRNPSPWARQKGMGIDRKGRVHPVAVGCEEHRCVNRF